MLRTYSDTLAYENEHHQTTYTPIMKLISNWYLRAKTKRIKTSTDSSRPNPTSRFQTTSTSHGSTLNLGYHDTPNSTWKEALLTQWDQESSSQLRMRVCPERERRFRWDPSMAFSHASLCRVSGNLEDILRSKTTGMKLWFAVGSFGTSIADRWSIVFCDDTLGRRALRSRRTQW